MSTFLNVVIGLKLPLMFESIRRNKTRHHCLPNFLRVLGYCSWATTLMVPQPKSPKLRNKL